MRVFIISPANLVTGGTELLHQFSRILSENHIENYMLYMDREDDECPVPEAFRKYDVKYVDRYIDASDSVLVVPEGWMAMVSIIQCVKGTIMAWWLSVDNYLRAFKEMIMEMDDLDVFSLKERENVVHFVQSRYAKDFLEREMHVKESYYLMDYINDDIVKMSVLYQKMRYKRRNICLYNPLKGYDILKPIIEDCRQDIKWMPLTGYKPEEMAALMCLSKVYVDFGNHPGKDRIPREAAICGCCVLTNRKGSAAYQEDVGIPECYKIEDTGDINKVLEMIYTLVDHYEEKKEDFSVYRNVIVNEKNEFIKDFHVAIDILKGCIEKQCVAER